MRARVWGQVVEWYGLRFRVPTDWQLARHARSAQEGQLVFIDGDRERLTLAWTQTESAPDLRRLVDEYVTRTADDDHDTVVSTAALPRGWFGLNHLYEDGDLLSFGVCHDAPTSRLLEFLLWGSNEHDNRQLLAKLINGFRVYAPAQRARRWQASGLCLTTPEGFELTSTSLDPTEIILEFQASTPALPVVTARARRQLVTRSNFDGDLQHALLRSHREQFVSVCPQTHAGYPAIVASGIEATPSPLHCLAGVRTAEVLMWSVEQENAVYEVTTYSSAQHPIHPRDFQVHHQLSAQN
jgi:hypothetical protein